MSERNMFSFMCNKSEINPENRSFYVYSAPNFVTMDSRRTCRKQKYLIGCKCFWRGPRKISNLIRRAHKKKLICLFSLLSLFTKNCIEARAQQRWNTTAKRNGEKKKKTSRNIKNSTWTKETHTKLEQCVSQLRRKSCQLFLDKTCSDEKKKAAPKK